MKQEYQLVITGVEYRVMISDEPEALLAAKAAGSAVIGLWEQNVKKDFSMVRYLIEDIEDADERYLEQVIRRTYGLPWQIAKTRRLIIRELRLCDLPRIPAEPEDSQGDKVFQNRETLAAYIDRQYGFYGYGHWALEDKETGVLVGIAGVDCFFEDESHNRQSEDSLQMGYHIFLPFRRQGYALEACQAIIAYVEEELGIQSLYIRTDASNEASVCLAKKLNFTEDQRDSQQKPEQYRLLRYCS